MFGDRDEGVAGKEKRREKCNFTPFFLGCLKKSNFVKPSSQGSELAGM
jgi:hypothetical protein